MALIRNGPISCRVANSPTRSLRAGPRLHTALADPQREGLVELEWVAGQTYRDLEDALDDGPWHVLHFISYGRYDRAADEEVLALVDETGRTHLVGADDINRLLADHDPLRLVVLMPATPGGVTPRMRSPAPPRR